MKHGLRCSFKNAWAGLPEIFRGRAIRIALILAVGVGILSLFINLTFFDRMVVLIFLVLGLCLEGFNSALEKLLDLISPNYNSQVKVIKDMLGGTLLIGFGGAVLVGILILLRLLGVF